MMRKLLLGVVLFWGISSLSFAQTYLNFTVNQPAMLVADAGVEQIICPGDSIAIGGVPAAVGGTSPFTYAWFPSNTLSSGSAANPMAGPAASTDFLLTVTDARNCTSQDTVTVVVDTCVGILPEMGLQEFTLYPNPNQGEFEVLLETMNPMKEVRFELVDLSGKVVWSENLRPDATRIQRSVNAGVLARGTYFLRASLDGNTVSRQVIIR